MSGQITPWSTVANLLTLRGETRFSALRHIPNRQVEYLHSLAQIEIDALVEQTLRGFGSAF